MFARILRDSLFRQKRRKLIVLAAVSLGTAAAVALGDIALDVGDRMSAELKSFGANLLLLPRGGGAPVVLGGEDVSRLRVPVYMDATELPKVRDNFWKNNILGLAPALDIPVTLQGRTVLLRGTWFERRMTTPGEGAHAGGLLTGIRTLNPYWSVQGRWPEDLKAAQPPSTSPEVPGAGSRAPDPARAAHFDSARTRPPAPPRSGADEPEAPDALFGRALAEALGLKPQARVQIQIAGRASVLTVAGILSSGDSEDEAILVPLETAWRLSGLEGSLSRVSVRALTTPESAVYERLGVDPRSLPPAEFEKWTCTPFVSSIAYELERAIPGAEARVVRRIADSEGNILSRISGLMVFIALLAAIGSALTVTSAFTTSALERRSEIGLLKALGAGTPRVVGLFVAEAAVVGSLGGLIGALAGAVMARWISLSVFGVPVVIRPLSFLLAAAAALAITSAGCIVPVRRIMQFRPFEVLRGL